MSGKEKKDYYIGYAFSQKEKVRAYNAKEALEIYCYDHIIAKKDAINLVIE